MADSERGDDTERHKQPLTTTAIDIKGVVDRRHLLQTLVVTCFTTIFGIMIAFADSRLRSYRFFK